MIPPHGPVIIIQCFKKNINHFFFVHEHIISNVWQFLKFFFKKYIEAQIGKLSIVLDFHLLKYSVNLFLPSHRQKFKDLSERFKTF